MVCFKNNIFPIRENTFRQSSFFLFGTLNKTIISNNLINESPQMLFCLTMLNMLIWSLKGEQSTLH